MRNQLNQSRKELNKNIKLLNIFFTICLIFNVIDGFLLLIVPFDLKIYRVYYAMATLLAVMNIEPIRINRLLYTFTLLLCFLCIFMYFKFSIGYISQFWTYICIYLCIRGKRISQQLNKKISVVKNGNF